ncbi:PRC-barrel domain-containing protein [Silicimonas algicola]|uniref:Sporulation protein YlmC with PRC-barrel domain n=1 Tax=Silicimonas algicola TaxID=1826607 RepID=A0A316FVZ0_9RHOB|nr:PRC-barrel domain-containing protein [Silicimonas algicola]PWK52758.1 sporulation protein YlmC with PRC-barrel domain [Silicimonas algicola]
MPTSGTSNMVSSADVNGTEVYGRDGVHIGSIDHLMIDKQSGNVAYAVMGFGGFLGLGEEHYPIPWNKLHYDTAKQGFVTDITADQVEGAPARTDDWHRDRDWERRTYDYYGVAPYWI